MRQGRNSTGARRHQTARSIQMRFADLVVASMALGFAARAMMIPMAIAAEGAAIDTLNDPAVDIEAAETPRGPELPPEGAVREALTTAPEWHAISSTIQTIDPSHRWLLLVEECVPGYVTVEGDRRPLRQTRVKITLPEGKPARAGKVLGYVMHVNNTQCALLAPDDPRVNEPPKLIEDNLAPWPNTCGIEVLSTEHPIDLDRDNRQEVVLKRYATIGARAGRGLMLLEGNEAGEPRIASLNDIVRGIRADELQLSSLSWIGKDQEPTLFVEHLGLEECRFLAELGIRGERACSDCCQITIVLQRATDLFYYPNYVRDQQSGQLDRLRSDLKEISIGDPATALNSEQEASLARAAAFFYLTGAGARSRSQLLEMLGARATQFRPQLLLDRLERYFTPVDTTRATEGPMPKAGAKPKSP